MKDIIRRILKEEIDYSLPITLTGSYRLPDDIKSKGDALHSFDRRQSDKFGGYMLRGKPIPSRWSSFVTLDQGVGINEVLRKLNSKGIKTDVTDLKVTVNKDSVDWQATIDESKDGKSYIGVHSRGSAGDGADSRALAQIPMLKSKNPKFCNWTEVLDLNITKPIKIRQFFLKYTKCKEDEEPNEETIEKNDELEMEFKDWVPGIYKLDTDKIWTYRLTDDKEWEAKKDDMDFVSLKDSLSDEKYEEALDNLKLAKLSTTESYITKKIMKIIREEVEEIDKKLLNFLLRRIKVKEKKLNWVSDYEYKDESLKVIEYTFEGYPGWGFNSFDSKKTMEKKINRMLFENGIIDYIYDMDERNPERIKIVKTIRNFLNTILKVK